MLDERTANRRVVTRSRFTLAISLSYGYWLSTILAVSHIVQPDFNKYTLLSSVFV